jgi:hypothetical protein
MPDAEKAPDSVSEGSNGSQNSTPVVLALIAILLLAAIAFIRGFFKRK